MPEDPKTNKQDEALLKEIRERYTYARKAWAPIIDEARIDMKYIAGDPWDSTDKEARRKSGRPALQMDELNQYVNQYINNLRQSPRAIKVNPAGNGATDKTAETRQNIIRGIEYKSAAWRNAYIVAAENQVNRSYGFVKIKRKYAKGKTFNQDIMIEGVANPESILYDPDVTEADWSDANYCFEISLPNWDVYRRKYPKATRRDFDAEDAKIAPEWIKEDHVVVCGYWKADIVERTLLELDTPEGPTAFYDDELPEGVKKKMKVLRSRPVEERQIKKYITNGIEILERHEEEPGEYIPVVPFIGKELWVDGQRKLLSMIRLARDPQMYYCYLCSQEAEEAKMTPKIPVIGYVGQFETDSETWQELTDVPHVYAQVDPVTDQAGQNVLPLPQWKQYVPNFQAYEVAKDGARRAIQAAMGITPLPTAAQRRNEKSGVALEKIEDQESLGSFHFSDKCDAAIELVGKIIEQYLDVTHDTERDVPIAKADGSHGVIRINTPKPYRRDEQSEPEHYPLVDENGEGLGDHDITISVETSRQSQRQAAEAFADQIFQNVEQLPLPPDLKAKFLALVIRMRRSDVGHYADEMADLLDPQQGSPQQNAAQAMAKLQQSQQQIAEMQQELQQLRLEKAGKVVEGQWKAQIEAMGAQIDKFRILVDSYTKQAVAEITTKAQSGDVRAEIDADEKAMAHEAAHELALQKDQQTHEKGMAQTQAAIASAQSAQDSSQDQAAAAQQAELNPPQTSSPAGPA